MEMRTLNEARRALGPLLDLVQMEKTPVALTRRNRPAAAVVPVAWRTTAVEALGEAPEVTDGPGTVDDLRAQLADVMRKVQFEGAHVRLHRHGVTAGFAVPVEWYERAAEKLGPENQSATAPAAE